MKATGELPNIVYILSDDLGYGDVSCLNPESKIATPRMDRLAREGMVFTDAHSNSAVCTPTRYGILTGRYCWRGRLKWNVLFGYSPPLIEPERVTVASLLKSQGYSTACIGKWHLGLGWTWPENITPTDRRIPDPGIDFSQPLTSGPHTVGFDESYIIPASLDMTPYCYIHNGRVTEPPDVRTHGSERPAFWSEGLRSPGFEHETCLLELTRRAEAYIDQQAETASGKPFFLYFATPSPHTPHIPRQPFQGSSAAGAYGDYVVEHDWSIGRILDALDRNGIRENTLVIVTSDNGAHIRGNAFDFEREFGHRSNHIYRGQKSDCWDGGHRVPFIARWPAAMEGGSVCRRPICLTDLLATAAEITSTPVPPNAGEDSVSMLPLLQGKEPEAEREAIVHHSFYGYFAIRQGPWKLIACRGSGGWSLPENEASATASMQLYHVENDPGENTNLAHAEPKIAEELLALLRRITGVPLDANCRIPADY